MKFFGLFALALLSIGLAGCSEFFPQKFSTSATYDAPRSGFRIVIEAHGEIPAGADVTDDGMWKAVVTPIGDVIAKTVTMQSVSGSRVTYAMGGQPEVLVDRRPLGLGKILADAGFTGLSDKEVEEAARVVECAADGPMGTTLSGQTNILTVVDVKFGTTTP